jgi:hypothetical protein
MGKREWLEGNIFHKPIKKFMELMKRFDIAVCGIKISYFPWIF